MLKGPIWAVTQEPSPAATARRIKGASARLRRYSSEGLQSSGLVSSGGAHGSGGAYGGSGGAYGSGGWASFSGGSVSTPVLPPYKLTAFHAFGMAFCVNYFTYVSLGPLTQGYAYGGWGVMTWTWLIASGGILCVACALAEMASASPVNGGLYYYAARLAPRRWRGLASYLTAWLSLLGTLSSLAGSVLVVVQYFASLLYLGTMDDNGDNAYVLGPGQLTAVYCSVVLFSALLNSLALSVTTFVLSFGIFWNLIAFVAYLTTMVAVAPSHQPASFVFAQPVSFPNFSAATGVTSPCILALLALSFPVNTMYGFESAIFMMEETHHASAVVPVSMIAAVASSCLLSWVMILTTGWCVQSADSLVDPDAATGGYNVALQVLWDAFQARYGNGGGGLPLTLLLGVPGIVCIVVWSAGVSRKLHAMSRDGLVPASAWLSYWRNEGESGIPPRHSVWATHGILLAFGALVPFQAQALFYQVMSFSVPLAYGAYLIPISLRLTAPPSRQPRPGSFCLGPTWRPWVNGVAVSYILLAIASLVCPLEWPATWASFNYAGPSSGVVLFLLLGAFFAPRRLGGVRHWWHGPVGGRIAGVAYAMWD